MRLLTLIALAVLCTWLEGCAPELRRAGGKKTPLLVFSHLAEQSLDHERPWNLFIRHLAGCPDEGAVDRERCAPATSRIDLANFRRSCETARVLWGLKGECK